MRCHWALRLSVAALATGVATAQTDVPAFESAMSGILTVWNSVLSSLEELPTPQPTLSTSSTSTRRRTRSSITSSTAASTASAVSITAAVTTPSSTSESTSITSIASSASSTSPSFSTVLPASTAISSLIPSLDDSGSSTGLSSRTRDIIIGVTVPIGLLILAALIVLFVVCHRRRKRNTRQIPDGERRYEETQFIGNNGDWEYGDNSHHGFTNAMGASVGSRDDPRSGLHSDVTPLMGASRIDNERTADSTNLPYPSPAVNAPRPVSVNRPITRKPVPNRASDGSAISSTSATQRDSHNGVLSAAGVGALAGVAAAHHHHNDNRYSHPSLAQPEHHHSPLAMHPTDQSGIQRFDNTHEDYFHWQPAKPSSPPFSPDDVGSTYRRSQRYSQAPVPTTPSTPSVPSAPSVPSVPSEPTTFRNSAPIPTTGIIAPTADQRRSLQNRHSDNSDSPDRRPSPGPRRRSLSGGGEVWQADSMFMPAMSQKSDGSRGRQYVSSAAAPPLPSPRQRTSDGSQTPLLTPPAAPYNRHLANARAIDAHNKTYGSNTDSSTSGDSWESAQAEINAWDDTDPGRYPRFSNGTPSTRAPLIPPQPVWQDGGQRRWSDEAPQRKNSPYTPNYQRLSAGNERRQRLRFSEGSPEYYDEAGLVGRAL